MGARWGVLGNAGKTRRRTQTVPVVPDPDRGPKGAGHG